MWIDKAFEVEIEFEGIDIRDTEAIGDEGVGAAASAYVMIAGGLGVADDIPGDEEVWRKTQLADDFEFAFHPGMGFGAQCVYRSISIDDEWSRTTCGERSRTIAAAASFAGEFMQELMVITLGSCEGLTVVDIAAWEFSFAMIEQGFRVADDLGVCAEGVVYKLPGDPMFAGVGVVGGVELAEHDIEIDAAHEFMDFVAGLIFIRDGLPYDETVEVAAEVGGEEAVDFSGHNADVFIGAEVGRDVGIGAVDDVDMLHFRGSLGQREVVEGTGGEEFAEFAPAFGVTGDAGVEVMAGRGTGFGVGGCDDGGAGAEFDTEDGFDITFTAFFDPCYGAGRVVDIRQRQGSDTTAGGPFGQLLGRKSAVFEGII